jgi:hypothetical protein
MLFLFETPVVAKAPPAKGDFIAAVLTAMTKFLKLAGMREA